MMRWLFVAALALLPLSEASAASGIVQITVKDAGGIVRNFNVLSDSGLIGGNLSWNNVICDPTTPTQCMAVSAGGAASVTAAQTGTWNITNISGTVSLPTGASTAANQTNASQKSQIVDGSGNVIASTTNALNVSAVQSGTWNINNISGTLSLPTGAATAANQSTEITDLASIVTNTAAAVPTIQSGTVTALISCDSHVFKHITTATDTNAVTGVTAKVTYVCGWRSRAAGTATWFLETSANTGGTCGTPTQLTGLASEAANTGEVLNPAFWSGVKTPTANGLCINSTGTGGVDVDIFYTQF